MKLSRIFTSSPAYDDRDQIPNYGQHPLELHFVVQGEKGALVYTINTGWYIEATRKARNSNTGNFFGLETHVTAMCSYHAHATLANSVDQDPHEHCGWLRGPCQAHEPFGYTGEPLGDLFMTLIEKGVDELWKELEKHYVEISR